MRILTAIAAASSLSAGVAALALPSQADTLQKRQLLNNLLGLPPQAALLPLLDAQNRRNLQTLIEAQDKGTVSHLLGQQNATSILLSYAKVLGATRDEPGLFMKANLDVAFGQYGLTTEPAEARGIPALSVSKSKLDLPQARAVKVRYGPYKVPANNVTNFIGEAGMLSNYPHPKVMKPCEGNCTILGFRAGLEYPNGTNANINTGMWLHHGVLFAKGPGRRDVSCSDRDISIPHISINSTAFKSERIYTFGNERTEIVFADMGAPFVGYKLRETDEFAALVELMNENPEDKVMYVTITYDVVDGHPFEDDVTAIWHDIRNCGTSEANPPAGKSKFELTGSWNSNFDGELIGGLAHLHDGGVTTSLEVDGKTACVGTANYGATPEFVSSPSMVMPGEGMESHGSAMKHISDINLCGGDFLTRKQIRKGENWTIKAAYDFDRNPGMKTKDGGWDEVMGIIVTYARKKGNNLNLDPPRDNSLFGMLTERLPFLRL